MYNPAPVKESRDLNGVQTDMQGHVQLQGL